jgi:hypothetical protein
MKIVSLTLLIVIGGVLLATSICMPSVLFSNEFLKGFIDHEILNIMAVIMTISIATIATIHIWFNELEDKHQKTVFGAARREINSSAFWFIGLFVAQLVLLIVRSFSVFVDNATAISIFNGGSLILLLMSVITLWDIMEVVKRLTPRE